MNKPIIALGLLAALSFSGCTEACEDSCEQEHNAVECLQNNTEAECEQVTQDLLTCVEACNE